MAPAPNYRAPSKQAVVFILDASASMNTPYPDESKSSSPTTRLECAKQAIQDMICDMFVSGQPKQHRIAVIVCHTKETRHHLFMNRKRRDGPIQMEEPISDEDEMNDEHDEDDQSDDDNSAARISLEGRTKKIPFPHLTQLGSACGLSPIRIEILSELHHVQVEMYDDAEEQDATNQTSGDFINAIFLAADALEQKTAGQKYDRRIVLLTDASTTIVTNRHRIMEMIQLLCTEKCECKLQVIGLGFDCQSTDYENAIDSEGSKAKKREDVEDENDNTDKDVDGMDEDDESDNGGDDYVTANGDEDDDDEYNTKSDREALLLSIANATGGSVISASTLQHVLDANKGRRIPKASPKKFNLQVAPGLVVAARCLKRMNRYKLPKLQTMATQIGDNEDHDNNNEPMVNQLGQEMLVPITTHTQFIDERDPLQAVDDKDVTTAMRFGSDLLSMTAIDDEGVAAMLAPMISDPEPHMQVLGYLPRCNIPQSYLIGPPHVISGDESHRSCALIAALSQALERLDKAAVCTYYRTKHSAHPILGALFPYHEASGQHNASNLNSASNNKTIRLIFLRLPYADDVQDLEMPALEIFLNVDDEATQAKSQACDDLIDAMMLPNDEGDNVVLHSGNVPSPLARSWHQTVVRRALDPKSKEVVASRKVYGKHDPMATPPDVLQHAQPFLNSFQQIFAGLPHVVRKKKEPKVEKKGAKRKRELQYKDFL